MAQRYFNLRREIASSAYRLERLQSPRLHMFLIVALATATGFLTTVGLLHVGVHHLWIRYASAVTLAYGVFLSLLWCWLQLRHETSLDIPDIPTPSTGHTGSSNMLDCPIDAGGGHFGGGGASGHFDTQAPSVEFVSDGSAMPSDSLSSLPDVSIGDVGDVGDSIHLVAVITAIIAVITLLGAVIASAWIVWSAPTFLGELVVDVALTRGLYKRMAGSYERYWFKTAVGHTFRPFISLLLLLTISGVLMQFAVPNAVSMGQFMHHFTKSYS